MQLFYTPDINPTDKEYILSEEESRHCVVVLRLGVGSQINLVDGRGGIYTATIIVSHPKKTVLHIVEVITGFKKRNHYLHMAVAPTKNIERFEWFLEKATEIGIDEITPIICKRSERKEVKVDRLNKVITAAIKQSQNAYHPKLNEAITYKHFLEKPSDGQKFIAHCALGDKINLKSRLISGGQYLILIGPEGDFADEEINDALTLGFKAISLGESRLRTETAALEACFEVNFLNR
jgi:16S rRNA (uracil1498-N3)-methyltransferase